jgi:hypothetical protein
MAGGAHESGEVAIGDGIAVDREVIDAHAMHGSFVGIVVVRSHAERAALDRGHVTGKRIYECGRCTTMVVHYHSTTLTALCVSQPPRHLVVRPGGKWRGVLRGDASIQWSGAVT